MKETSPRFRPRPLRRLPATVALLGLALAAAACGPSQPEAPSTAQVTLTGAKTLNATYVASCGFFGEKGFQITLGPQGEEQEKVDPTLFLSFSDYAGSSSYDTLLVANVPGKPEHHGMEQGRGGAHVDVTATRLGQPTRSVLAGTFSGSYQSAAGTTHVSGTFSGCTYPGVMP